jgi:hypothetical protein
MKGGGGLHDIADSAGEHGGRCKIAAPRQSQVRLDRRHRLNQTRHGHAAHPEPGRVALVHNVPAQLVQVQQGFELLPSTPVLRQSGATITWISCTHASSFNRTSMGEMMASNHQGVITGR